VWQENNITEFKLEFSEKLELEKEVVAFLNSKKGDDIYIGVADDGTVIGVNNPDSLQLSLSDRIKNNIEPSCLGLYDVFPIEKDGKQLFISL